MSLRGTSPIVPVSDVAATTQFYVDTLGFQHVIDNPAYGYACFRRGDALIAITRADGDEPLQATRNNISAQIWVENIDALWSELKEKLKALPEGRVNGPLEQAYGTKELHVKCPDGFLMLFTQYDSLEA